MQQMLERCVIHSNDCIEECKKFKDAIAECIDCAEACKQCAVDCHSAIAEYAV
jgi:hypothetical protein